VTAIPEDPYPLTALHLNDEDETQTDAWQLPNLTPAEQLKGAHAACSHTGFTEESLAFTVESAEPNETPETNMNELPVEGTFFCDAISVAINESQVNAELKVDERLETDTATDETLSADVGAVLHVADDELDHMDAWHELVPARIPADLEVRLKPDPATVMLELPVLGTFKREVVKLLTAFIV